MCHQHIVVHCQATETIDGLVKQAEQHLMDVGGQPGIRTVMHVNGQCLDREVRVGDAFVKDDIVVMERAPWAELMTNLAQTLLVS